MNVCVGALACQPKAKPRPAHPLRAHAFLSTPPHHPPSSLSPCMLQHSRADAQYGALFPGPPVRRRVRGMQLGIPSCSPAGCRGIFFPPSGQITSRPLISPSPREATEGGKHKHGAAAEVHNDLTYGAIRAVIS